MTVQFKRVAVIGTGVIGASWAALFLAKGLDVVATDVAPGAEGATSSIHRGRVAGARDTGASFVPRRIDVPPEVHHRPAGSRRRCRARAGEWSGAHRLQAQRCTRSSTPCCRRRSSIASSSSGLTMSEIQAGCPLHPGTLRDRASRSTRRTSSARRDRRRRQDVGRHDPACQRVLYIARQAHDPPPQGSARPRPPTACRPPCGGRSST